MPTSFELTIRNQSLRLEKLDGQFKFYGGKESSPYHRQKSNARLMTTKSSIRKPKKGFVYLLKSDYKDSNFTLWKFGCSKNPKQRIKVINQKNKFKQKFKLVYSLFTGDMFSLENNFRWFCANSQNIAYSGEFFGSKLEDHQLIEKLNNLSNGKK